MNYDILRDYVFQHSTPGDEDAVIEMLRMRWEETGWSVSSLGHQALLARSADWNDANPTVLVTAHADSPGFIVQRMERRLHGTAIALGSPHVYAKSRSTKVLIKSNNGVLDEGSLLETKVSDEFRIRGTCNLARGQRVCWQPEFKETRFFLEAPFLDNRIGCFLLHLLAELKFDCNVILAATGNEEFLGFGASALAAAVKPDLAIVLDVTYEAPEQCVEFGKGPVLTLSDKSIVIPPKQVNVLQNLCKEWDLPLQYEVYNYSGTDAMAFGRLGHTCSILPLLVPTKDNHTKLEKACKQDVELLYEMLQKLLTCASLEKLNCTF